MRISYGLMIENHRDVFEVQGNRARVGRGGNNDLVLNNPSIAPEAVVFHIRNGAWEVVVTGSNIVEIGSKKLWKGSREPLVDGQHLTLLPYSFTVYIPEEEDFSEDRKRAGLDKELNDLLVTVHLELLRRMDLATRGSTEREDNDEYHRSFEYNVEDIAKQQQLLGPARVALTDHIAGLCLRRQCMEGLLSKVADKSAWTTSEKLQRLLTEVPEREHELELAVSRCFQLFALEASADLSVKIQRVEKDFWTTWEAALSTELYLAFKHYLAQRYLKKELKDIVFGYGPLEDLLRNPTISEIMVVDRERIFIEKSGVLENSGRRFISDEVTESIIQRIVQRVGKRIDKASPLVDARLSDGSRVNAVIPPLAVSGPCLTIRKFPTRKMTVADLVKKGSFPPFVAEFLKAIVLARKNILVSGGTGTGKTTLLNCLSDFIPNKERIVTIEDTAELQLQKSHVVRMETKAANVEGTGAYSIRDLVKNALRMRPDRIVVGECRGAEALDMLQAMNSGHDGSLTTVHANNSADVVLRLEVLVQMAANLPVSSIHRQIASAIDVVVQVQRLRNGRRCISQITEFVDVDPEFGGVRMRDLFLLDGEGPDAQLMPTGSLPTFMDELIEHKLLVLETFYQGHTPS